MKITTVGGNELEVQRPWLLRRLSGKWDEKNEQLIDQMGGNQEACFSRFGGGDWMRPRRCEWFACATKIRGYECDWVAVSAAEAARIASETLDGAYKIKNQLDIWRRFGEGEADWEKIPSGPGEDISPLDLPHDMQCHALLGEEAIREELAAAEEEILRRELHLAEVVAGFEFPAESPAKFLECKISAAERITRCRRILAWLSVNEIEWLAKQGVKK